MSGLTLIECHLDQTALLRFLRAQGIDNTRHAPDLGYGVHAWLKAAFGELAPRPWRLLADGRRPPRVLAYSRHGQEALIEHMRQYAEPMAQAICPPESVAGKGMPHWKAGRELGFEVLVCPVGRKARVGTEKDLFLMAVEREPAKEHDRTTIYSDWLRGHMQGNGAVEVSRVWLEGFRRVQQLRKTQGPPGARGAARLERPEALLNGALRILDPERFEWLLGTGIGRHRAFGYGMLLLKPPTR